MENKDFVKAEYCSKCGTKLMEEEKFCHNCGVAIIKNYQEGAGTYSNQNQYYYAPKGKGQMVFGIILMALGGLFSILLQNEKSSYSYRESTFANYIYSGTSSYAPDVDTMFIIALVVLFMGAFFFLIGLVRYVSSKK